MSISKKSIKRRLNRARKSKGFTQKEIADYLKIEVSTYRRIEKGTTPVINPHVRKVASLIKVPIEEIITTKTKKSKIDILKQITIIVQENEELKAKLEAVEHERIRRNQRMVQGTPRTEGA